MLANQQHKFKIPQNVSYLNCAFMSPLLRTVEKVGHEAITLKCNPFKISAEDFFSNTLKIKQLFAQLIDVEDANNIAVIPSVSYGIATVTNNIVLKENDEIIVIGEQFPSNIYSWQRLAEKYKAKITIIAAKKPAKGRGKQWNQDILNAITSTTKVVAMAHVHWSDGTLFDLKAIRKKTHDVNALLVIDATQSVGALPFSVKEIQPDALICAGYKWLMASYSIGLAYYSNNFCKGIPIEENWINRKNSENFAGLVAYEQDYQPKAGRFNVGEMSNFALTPMLIKSLKQLLKWQPKNIQEYCNTISKEAIKELQNLGCFIEDEAYRGNHLFGIYLPNTIDITLLKKHFEKQQVFVSFRGNAIRVSLHLYNTKADFDKLVACFKKAII